MKERLERLLCVKSIVTIALSTTFVILSLRQCISTEQFLTIFTMVVSFYFGTQHENRPKQ